jgi:predicted anti-sigma-YlaC factor YlaD
MPQKNSELPTCTEPELVYLFPGYIIGEGNPDERRRIEEHLAECAECRKNMKFFSDLQRVGHERFGQDHSRNST